MPLEISEIGVRLAIGSVAATGCASDEDGGARGSGLDPRQQEQIVVACVAEVLRMLRMREER